MAPKSSLIFNEQHKTAKKRNRKYIIAALITGIILVAALGIHIRISVMTKSLQRNCFT